MFRDDFLHALGGCFLWHVPYFPDKHAAVPQRELQPCAQACPLFGALMQKALDLVRSCDCVNDSGCPACIQHPDCGEYNAVLSKRAAMLVLSATMQAELENLARMALQASCPPA